jgi:hypothetical protein
LIKSFINFLYINIRERESIASLLGKPPPIPALSLQIRDGHGLAGLALDGATIGQRQTI